MNRLLPSLLVAALALGACRSPAVNAPASGGGAAAGSTMGTPSPGSGAVRGPDVIRVPEAVVPPATPGAGPTPIVPGPGAR